MSTRSSYLAATGNGAALNDVLTAQARYGWKLPYPNCTVWVPRVPRQTNTTWQVLYPYLALDLVRPTTRNGHLYQAIGPATSGVGEPVWPTATGATVIDGGVTWHEVGADIDYDDILTVTMGAGTNNVLSFYGYVRQLDFRFWPRRVGIIGHGRLVRAAMYENHENPTNEAGGLLLHELTGNATPTDEEVVRAALTKALVPFTPSDIGGTGVVWGTRARPQTYVWRAGAQFNAMQVAIFNAKGESALEYVHRWDEASAVYTDPTAPLGFYRLYESPNGIYRKLIGGRPRNTVDLTFTEGNDADILDGSSSRQYPLGNRVLATGFDPGLGTNAVYYDLQSSNPYQPATEQHTFTFNSPFIEQGYETATWAAAADYSGDQPVRPTTPNGFVYASVQGGTSGGSEPTWPTTIGQQVTDGSVLWTCAWPDDGRMMPAERAARAIEPDINRETVTIRFTTKRDDPINPAMTVLIQGAGGLPDRLGIGEALWVDEVTRGVDDNGRFTQTLACTGGGLPDGFTPAPAW